MQGEKPPENYHVLSAEERMLTETREEVKLLRDDIAYLSKELGTFLSTQHVTDESAQNLYRTLRAELDALEERAITTLELEKLDRASFAKVLGETLRAYTSFEHMLLTAQKQTSGAAHDDAISQLREVQATIISLREKALRYGIAVSVNE